MPINATDWTWGPDSALGRAEISSYHLGLIPVLIIKQTREKHLNTVCLHLWHSAGLSDMQPGVCVFCQLRGQARQPLSLWIIGAFFLELKVV